ncbi:uncharacterized protein LOC120333120 [Styela clava]|uniref:2-oxoglutarate-Fe(II) type oxidoreductase ppzD-like n=1 Tax=Styela clava TaxID=7725 RepID=UPI001939A69E|nr:2-oxoglutarate-Fe(II) type oxidoreductase ppzD-like [Styela clava]
MPIEKKKAYFDGRFGLTYLSIGARKSHSKDIIKSDYLECLMLAYCIEDHQWPDIPGFRAKIQKFEEKCKFIGLQVFKSLSLAMKLKNKDNFFKSHLLVNSEKNPSLLKVLQYPPVNSKEVRPSFAVHTDFGSLMFLFSDDLSVLQMHRVVVPEDRNKRLQSRRSMAFFSNRQRSYVGYIRIRRW